MAKDIVIKGAKENNLKNIDVTIPRDKMVVLTGLSGSGKSSLAFDTIYAEGQRKYMDTASVNCHQPVSFVAVVLVKCLIDHGKQCRKSFW